MAPGSNATTPCNAVIIAASIPTPAIPFNKTEISNPLKASTIPAKNSESALTTAFTSFGTFLAIPLITSTKKSVNKLASCGVYLTRADAASVNN